MLPTIVCLSAFSADQVRELAGTDEVVVRLVPAPPAPGAVRSAVPDADVVIADGRHRHRLDRPALQLMRRCRLIQQPAAGFDVIDHHAAAQLGIPVANVAGYNQEAVADWVIMSALSLLRHGAWHDRAMRREEWIRPAPDGRELGSLTVGIVGMGGIGRAVSRRLRAFGSRILYTDPFVRSDLAAVEPVSLPELLRRCDLITLHLPLAEGTRGLIDTAEFELMRPGALLLNASRGPIVSQTALIGALHSRLGGAALDVFEAEPLPGDSPLRGLDNVLLSPHVAGWTVEAVAAMFELTGANIRRVLGGQPPINVVNGVPFRSGLALDCDLDDRYRT